MIQLIDQEENQEVLERTTQSARSRESIANERQKHTVIHVPKVMNCYPLAYNQYSKATQQF